MLNSFEVSNHKNEDFSFSHMYEKDIIINYNHKSIFNIVSQGSKTISCYGYTFDVRNPKSTTEETLENLLSNDNIEEDIKFLNGHFIIIYNIDGKWQLVTDAVSITPIYVDFDNKSIVTKPGEQNSIPLNSNIRLRLNDFSVERIAIPSNSITDERIERIILDNVKEQHKYFTDKDFTLNFRRNRMIKALITILQPALFNKTLNLRQDDEDTLKVGKWIARDFQMNLIDNDSESGTQFICNAHLMNYKYYNENEVSLNAGNKADFLEKSLLDDEKLQNRYPLEYNLNHKLKYRNEEKAQLIYDPFNVRVIQERIYSYRDSKSFDPLNRIIKILFPMIDFYDFAGGVTLLQKVNQLKAKNDKLQKEMKSSNKKVKFIHEARKQGIEVSHNLTGQLNDDGITVQPVSSNISKEDLFEVNYTKSGQGLILVETFFDNPKNAHRIKIVVNGEESNIDEFLEGKFVNVDSKLDLKMYYERDYNTASWQKAGKIKIKEVD
ncbi:hypothetical protein [Salinicoccus sp. YB14-2]|uniref:hypothetical protein n=1 Tax=Salinicoccus sp. YB14-2 TaxID=1572701 RepID=UPI000690DD98|nr:hypothetical protein [Salinicoccus sp. YB14-2]